MWSKLSDQGSALFRDLPWQWRHAVCIQTLQFSRMWSRNHAAAPAMWVGRESPTILCRGSVSHNDLKPHFAVTDFKYSLHQLLFRARLFSVGELRYKHTVKTNRGRQFPRCLSLIRLKAANASRHERMKNVEMTISWSTASG